MLRNGHKNRHMPYSETSQDSGVASVVLLPVMSDRCPFGRRPGPDGWGHFRSVGRRQRNCQNILCMEPCLTLAIYRWQHVIFCQNLHNDITHKKNITVFDSHHGHQSRVVAENSWFVLVSKAPATPKPTTPAAFFSIPNSPVITMGCSSTASDGALW